MKKCDVIIPVYNAAQWVEMCVYALLNNTPAEYIQNVYLMNDCSGLFTQNCLQNLKERYGDKIIIVNNEENLGFIKNVNRALALSTADTVLLLNSDCLIAHHTIPNLISHLDKNEKIGLISPISSNAANVTLPLREGYSFIQMDELLHQNFFGTSFPACTIVGNCLMITRHCLQKVGYLDEIYGMGYGEETDYQFKAMEKGFEAKIAIDTYVFHQAEASFEGTNERKEKNAKIFFERWGTEYHSCMEEYVKQDPIAYIQQNLSKEEIVKPDVAFFLPDLIQGSGGTNVVVSLVNYLNMNGIFATIIVDRVHEYHEIMTFAPYYRAHLKKLRPKCIVGTLYPSIFFVKKIAELYDIPYVNFMQGYEPCFDNGSIYSWAELATKNSTNILAISQFLASKCSDNFQKEATVIPNSINMNLLHPNENIKREENIIPVVTLIFRNNYAKGDFVLAEILKLLTIRLKEIEINVIYFSDIMFPINNSNIKINYIKGPLNAEELHEIMAKSDIYVDTSFMEGFGLTPLEAMAQGVVPVIANSFGIAEYATDENSFVIDKVNDAQQYIDKIQLLIQDKQLREKMSKAGKENAKNFHIADAIQKYIIYFSQVTKQELNLSEEEKKASQRWYVPENMLYTTEQVSKSNKVNENIKKRIPVGIKKTIKKLLGK